MKLNAATEPVAELPNAHLRSRLLGPTVCWHGMGEVLKALGEEPLQWVHHECDGRAAHHGAHACRCGVSWG